IAWQTPTGNGMQRVREHPALKGLTLPALGGQGGSGGVLVTKTLVIYGLNGSGYPGAPRGGLVAYDKMTGCVLAQVPLPAAPLGPPMSYRVGGKQYISLTLQGGQLVSLAVSKDAAPGTQPPAAASSGALTAGLPAGPGREAMVAICSSCHSPSV